MKLENIYVEKWRNLKEFEINFSSNEFTTVLIGANGTGKSNLLEAIVWIFRFLDLGRNHPPFNYKIKYLCFDHNIEVHGQYYTYDSTGKQKQKRTTSVWVDGKSIALSKFRSNGDTYLPRHIFGYYSGKDTRLEKLFDAHAKDFYDTSLGTKKPKKGQLERAKSLRRLFYCRPEHSQFVLLAYYAEESEYTKEFLNKYLGIDDLESILVVLSKPYWFKGSKPSAFQKKHGDSRFWYSAGVVKNFVGKMWEYSLAPIRHEERIKIDFRERTENKEFLYLFLKDKEKLKSLARVYSKEPTQFFRDLESTYINDLIEEVRTTVQRKDRDGRVTFSELSEGEKQFLTVLGLMKFTKDDETLFLLDEPDTHLNPAWKYDYLKEINNVIGPSPSSQLLLCTHDPLVIGGLAKEQVRVLARTESEQGGQIVSFEPDEDPRGMGVAGLLKSEMFGLRSTVDPATLEKLDDRFKLYAKGKDRTETEEKEFLRLSDELVELGFTRDFRDPYYQEYATAVSKRKIFKKPVLSKEEKEEREKIVEGVLDDIFSEEEK
ncbi:MAG: AAA family ATPase [Proteobacteria bacterium]|nr:AAA family ATPase [Pseudomonadota bacterium]MBU1714506.1 AAA family ATPase [Pseudomonadota bacterium]